MKNLLVIYPVQFNCQSKFSRKMTNIVSSLDNYNVSCLHDCNGLIKGFFDELNKVVTVIESLEDALRAASHVVIFDDGLAFPKESSLIFSLGIPCRRIKIKITRVVNIKTATEYQGLKSTQAYEYIGRGSYWGNPYSMYEAGDDRDEVIRKFKYDFDFDKFPKKKKSEVFKLAGKTLGCFCKPQACHGDVIANYLNSYDDDE